MSYKDESYYRKFPREWIYFLKDELSKEFPDYNSGKLLTGYLPPVSKSSLIGKIAARFPSRPEGITLGGIIYLTPIMYGYGICTVPQAERRPRKFTSSVCTHMRHTMQ